MRIEKDFLGTVELPNEVMYGIHSHRARQNFDNITSFPFSWYCAMGTVKYACYLTYKKFKQTASQQIQSPKISFIDDNVIDALIQSSLDVSTGKYFEHFIVPAIQGGAGTSINMNINEIITNAALKYLGYKPGDYHIIDPIEHANIFQSTNDTVATALRIAIMQLLQQLEEAINQTRFSFEQLERQFRDTLRPGYTQMQEAVPTSFGKMFSAYNDALSRDWWRVSKCFERIKTVNLGGGAIGTGLAVPRFFIVEVVNELKQITHLPLARSENLVDTTQNFDSFVEVHAILKSHAVNLEKISNDIRILSADIGHKIMNIPAVQAGSSIMPGKVNPVINEFIISIAHQIYANDLLISNLCGQGLLELNPYVPTIGKAIIESLTLLISANKSFTNYCINHIIIKENYSLELLYKSASITTALIPYIGYHKATEIALLMKNEDLTVFEANNKLKYLPNEKLQQILTPHALIQLGYSIKEL
ncbi:MAG: lyase family protein [Bacteroidales bacterium]|nr:lyase family protein [Bacteroidales bacterium]